MDIKGLNWGGMVSPSRSSIKDISNLPQRNQGEELPVSNADVEKAPSIKPYFSSEKDLQPDPHVTLTDWFEGQGYIRFTFASMTANLQEAMESVEAQARQIVGDKEWDVSIDENNDLVIYGDDLTDDEREKLGALVHEAGVDQKMNFMREDLIKAFGGVQRNSANDFRVDIFDNFTMDKTSFQKVFRLREHIENSNKNPFNFVEVIKGDRYLWGSGDSLFDQIKKRGGDFDQSSKGYVVDVHA